MDDYIKRILAEQERFRKVLTPYESLKQAIDHSASISYFQAITKQRQDLAKLVSGLVASSTATDALKTTQGFRSSIASLSAQLDIDRQQQFFTATKAASDVWANLDSPTVADIIARYEDTSLAVKRAMEGVNCRWIDQVNTEHSVARFAALHGIGKVLASRYAYEDRLSETLRYDLGDWRQEISWPERIFESPVARSEFYVDQGFNPDLTALPYEAFEETVIASGLIEDSDEIWSISEAEDDSFTITNQAHAKLIALEIAMRSFLASHMQKAFGERWIKTQVPGDTRKRWEDARARHPAADSDKGPLLDYAEITDYVQIITRRDNWDGLFRDIFLRQSDIQESFQRIYPIRHCTMHARLITQDDLLLLYVEGKRILQAINRAK